jgi:hypothetical protein
MVCALCRDTASDESGEEMGAVAFPTFRRRFTCRYGVVGAMKDIKKYTAAGDTVYVFGL